MADSPVRLLVLYADKDINARDELLRQLKLPIKHGLIEVLHRGQIRAGYEVRKERRCQLAEANIVVLLVSADLLNDEDDEIEACIARTRDGVVVMPVLLRHVFLGGAVFEGLQQLPSDGVFMSRKRDRDEAWSEVVASILEIVEEVASRRRPPPAAATPSDVMNILCLVADPRNAGRVAIGRIVSDIDKALQASRHRERFKLEQALAVTPGDLVSHLLRHRPTILQFIGHGVADGRIVLENEAGMAVPVTPAALAHLFAPLKEHPIRCVLLDACYSIEQAATIAQHIDCVIGIYGIVNEVTSAIVSRAFYTAIADGRSVSASVELATAAAHLNNCPDADALEIRMHGGIDPATMKFV